MKENKSSNSNSTGQSQIFPTCLCPSTMTNKKKIGVQKSQITSTKREMMKKKKETVKRSSSSSPDFEVFNRLQKPEDGSSTLLSTPTPPPRPPPTARLKVFPKQRKRARQPSLEPTTTSASESPSKPLRKQRRLLVSSNSLASKKLRRLKRLHQMQGVVNPNSNRDDQEEELPEPFPVPLVATASYKRPTGGRKAMDKSLPIMDSTTSGCSSSSQSPVIPSTSREVVVPPRRPRREENAKMKKPLTSAEINQMKETNTYYHSHLFRKSTEETLQRMIVPKRYSEKIEKFTTNLQSFLNQLKNRVIKVQTGGRIWLQYRQIAVPLNARLLKLMKNYGGNILFRKPTKPLVSIGEMALGINSSINQMIVVDFCIQLPVAYIQANDFLDFRYIWKRALYITHLVAEMLEYEQFQNLSMENFSFSYWNNDALKPIVEIRPLSDPNEREKLIIRLFVVADFDLFSCEQFISTRNNLPEMDKEMLYPTQHYNTSILMDLTMIPNHNYAQLLFSKYQNIREAGQLLIQWLKQRQLNEGFHGFTNNILIMYIVYLFHKEKLNVKMSNYHVMRTVWYNLAASKWDELNQGISLCSYTDLDHKKSSLEQMHKDYDVVFIDETGWYNLCSNLFGHIYQLVKAEARLALQLLDDNVGHVNAFRSLFKKKCPIYSHADYILKFSKNSSVDQFVNNQIPMEKQIRYAGSIYLQLFHTIIGVLKKGLGQRIRYFLPFQNPAEDWGLMQNAPKCCEYLYLGFVLNPEQAFHLVDKGPESIDPEATAFRAFWGEITKLRRFQDGSILESVVWSQQNDMPWEKRQIPDKIIKCLFGHHFQLDSDEYECIGDQFDTVFRLNKSFRVEKFNNQIPNNLDAQAQSLNVIREFDDLAQILYNLKQNQIHIIGVCGISPILYYCDPQPILPMSRIIDGQLRTLHVIEVLLQLEYNQRWPESLDALRGIKNIIYYDIGQELNERYQMNYEMTYDGLYLLRRGYCFRLELIIPKEISLLKKDEEEDGPGGSGGVVRYIDSTVSLEMEKRHNILPNVCSALKALHQTYPSFGPAVMIAKRWLYVHLMDNGLWPNECTELLMAYIYQEKSAFGNPACPQVAFIRFLRFLVESDWQNEIFRVSFNNSFDEKMYKTFESEFRTNRSQFPSICIVTSYDLPHNFGHWWCLETEATTFAINRIVSLAQCSLDNIETSIMCPRQLFLKSPNLFQSSTEGYDLLIEIKASEVPNALCTEYSSPFVTFSKPNWRLSLPGADFMKDAVSLLRSGYSHFAAFFYNPCGGKEILVKWKPNIFVAKEFQEQRIIGTMAINEGRHVWISRRALQEDFEIVLKDFYQYIGPLK